LPDRNGQPDNIATAVTEVSERAALLIRDEIELAKAEVAQKVASLARAAAAVAAGAVFGVFAVIFGLLTAAWGINSALSSIWEGFAIVFGALLILTIAAFLFAWRKFKVATPPTPTMAIDEARKIRETVSAKPGARS
jgi:uncharacterized small protein (DUF1192 family)